MASDNLYHAPMGHERINTDDDRWANENAREAIREEPWQTVHARIGDADGSGGETEMSPLPEGWGETATGEPMPDVAAAVRRSRESR